MTIQEKFEKSDLPIRMLFLDPDCQQAKIRAFREHLLSTRNHHAASLERYLDNDTEYHQSTLYKQTKEAIDRMKGIILDDAERRKSANLPPSKIEIGIYDSAPHSFIMRVDDTVLMEPYQYGKIVPEESRGTPAILGKDMPIMEFSRHGPKLFAEHAPDQLRAMRLRMPFDLLQDHFNFVWRIAHKAEVNVH